MKATVIALGLMFLSGCATYSELVDKAVHYGCNTPEGQTARLTFRTINDPIYRSKDLAICLRCPGEEALGCTGDPKALPPAQ